MNRSVVFLLVVVAVSSAGLFAAAPVHANPTICSTFPEANCEEDSWASVDYYQTGLEFCVNTKLDADAPFCPSHSQRPCPEPEEEAAAFTSRSGVISLFETRVIGMHEARAGEVVAVQHTPTSTPPGQLVGYVLRQDALTHHCEEASEWTDLSDGGAFVLGNVNAYAPGAGLVNNRYFLVLWYNAGYTGEYTVTRA